MKILFLLVLVCLPVHCTLKRCKTYPYLDKKGYVKKLNKRFDDLHRQDHIIIDVPPNTRCSSERTQISITSEEVKEDNINPCNPGKTVVVGAICTGITGVMTAIITATVTLIVHFTTK